MDEDPSARKGARDESASQVLAPEGFGRMLSDGVARDSTLTGGTLADSTACEISTPAGLQLEPRAGARTGTRAEAASGRMQALLRPLWSLAGQRETWAPALLGGVLWRAATNPSTLIEMLGLLKLAPFGALTGKNPRFALKYLTHDYLARSMSVAERAGCFVHHHRRMHGQLPEALLADILARDVTVLVLPGTSARLTVSLGLTQFADCDKEGEYCLKFQVDGVAVYLLSFTLVPGRMVRAKAAEAFLISRLQGKSGRYAQIRLATRELHDVAPGATLMAALQGIALALGIEEIVSVCARDQSSYAQQYDGLFVNAYDDFFAELGMDRNEAGFFASAVPIPEKPLEMVKKGHKLRTRQKRAFKGAVMQAVMQFFERGQADGGAAYTPVAL